MKIIIYANLIPFLALLFFIVLIGINPVFNRKQARLFLVIALLNLLMIIAVSADYVCARSTGDMAWIVRRITSFLNFSISPVIPLLLYQIFEHKKSPLGVYIPIMLNAALCFTSIFSGIIFFISSNNQYERGPLFIVPFFTTVGYLIYIIAGLNKNKLTSRRVERYFLLSIIGLLMVMLILEIVFSFNFLLWDVSCLGTVMYYLLLNIYQSIVDPLTGAYNRQMYMKTLEKLSTRRTGIIGLADINNFKEVNDKFGHDVGDQYLITFVEVLNRNFGSIAELYRIGGDEFIMIAQKADVKKFEGSLRGAREEAKEHQIQFACGYKVCVPGVEVYETLKEADQMMYEDKKSMKKESSIVS